MGYPGLLLVLVEVISEILLQRMPVRGGGEGGCRLTAPIDLSFGVTDNAVFKPGADNCTDEVAAVVETHHDSSVSRVRDLDRVGLRRRPQHDESDSENNTACDHVTTSRCSSLDGRADEDDHVRDQHRPQ